MRNVLKLGKEFKIAVTGEMYSINFNFVCNNLSVV